MTDYIIVGSGLAGIAFCEIALQHGRTVMVYDDNSHNASVVAGGLYNPVILKRFSVLQNAQEQLRLLQSFYTAIEERLHVRVNHPMPTIRKFFSAEEQNDWFAASDKAGLAPFLSTKIIHTKYSGIDSPFGYGEVLQTGYVETGKLLARYREYLLQEGCFQAETFEYGALASEADYVRYKGVKARHIIFAEGFGINANPYFKALPLEGTKGELFIIRAPGLNLDMIMNTNVFILPLGNHLFKAGATYNWTDKTQSPTVEGRQELINRISEVLNCEFEIVEHLAGIRPTVRDRRPLIGTHYMHRKLHILNGLGTRGVMLGPSMAKSLYGHIEYGIPIETENDIVRFYKRAGITS